MGDRPGGFRGSPPARLVPRPAPPRHGKRPRRRGRPRRSRFLEEHVAAIESVAADVPVAGYLHWSLVDNFEWLDGYGPKFGLFAVDPVTFQRHPRPSAETFRRLGRQFLEAVPDEEFTRL
ncbi:MAG TPA: family 1 glycosylhydrolase [Thermoanaerobaculia bacterium]